MTDSWHYRAFTRTEHEDRLQRAQALMQEQQLAACICTSPELIYYFSGYEAHTHHAIGSQALILPAEGREPVLILRDGDAPQADETLVLGDARAYRRRRGVNPFGGQGRLRGRGYRSAAGAQG